MERDDLKLLWQEIQLDNSFTNETEIKKIINRKHSRRISEILLGRKREMIVYIAAFVLFIAFIMAAFIFLRLNVISISVVFSIGTFLFMKTTHAISTFMVLSKKTENESIQQSAISFWNMLKKIQLMDFIFHLVFFYGLAIIMLIVFLSDMEGIKNMGLLIPILCIILILLIIPWLLKNMRAKRYKTFYAKLKESSTGEEDC